MIVTIKQTESVLLANTKLPPVVYDSDGILASFKIRIHGIDCPEYGQHGFEKAKQALENFFFDLEEFEIIKYKFFGIDKYGRLLCKIYISEIDIGLELVKQGLAWSYPDYKDAELKAIQEKRGIWKNKNNIPPWVFRKNQKEQNARKRNKTK